jgi:glycosyltransferase involved in cell wall biosynthesis
VPKISVLTPVYNAADYIGEAIKSVAESDFTDYEHIIVDDGSTDLSLEAINKAVGSLSREAAAKVKIFSKSNSGEADTDNYALARSSGEYIVVLNADDIVGPYLFSRSVEELDKSPQVVVSYPDWTMIDGDGKSINQVKTKNFSIETLIGGFECLPGPGAFIRKSALGQGIFRDPSYPLISDYECWQRLSLMGPFLRIPEFHAFWRLHGENLSVTSRGKIWAQQAISVARNFADSNPATKKGKLRKLASLGLSRAYLLGALQGTWDTTVPLLHYLSKSLSIGIINGRIMKWADFPILIQVAYVYFTRAFRRS